MHGECSAREQAVPSVFTRSKRRAQSAKTFGITRDIFKQGGWSAEIVNTAGDRTHFQIPVDFDADPLHFLIFFKDIDIVPEVIDLHGKLLIVEARCWLGFGSKVDS